jgi:hypothetical protein
MRRIASYRSRERIGKRRACFKRTDLVSTGVALLVGGEGDDGVGEDAKFNGSDESNNHYE